MADAAAEGAQAFNIRQQGLENAQLAERKTAAYNALARVYGPEAGDPDLALKMQEYGQRQQTNPLAVQQAQANLTGTNLVNTGREQTNAFAEQMNPLKVQQQTEANREQPMAFAAEQAQRNAQTGLTRAQTAHTGVETQAAQFGLNTARAAAQRQAEFSILSALSDTADQGGDIGTTFDHYAPLIAQMEGVDSAHMAPLRQRLVQDPQGTINKLQTAIMARDAAATGGKNGKSAASVMTPLQQRAQTVHAMEAIHERIASVPEQVDQATALLNQMPSSAIIRRARSVIPGTPEYQFEQLMKHQIGENIGLTDLQNMRSSGFSLGRVTNMEMQASKNAYANMDLGQDLNTLRANAARIKLTYSRLNSNMADDIQRTSIGIPNMSNASTAATAPKGAAPAAGPQPSPQDIVNELRRRGVVK